MDDNASAKRTRPVNFPAAIPRTMTTTEQRASIDAYAEMEGIGTGATVRHLIDLGLDMVEERTGLRP